MKTCLTCKEALPSDSFHKKASAKDGLHPHCKLCRKAIEQERYQENKETKTSQMAAYYQANKTKWKGYNLKWHKTNPHVMRAHTAAYKARKLQATPKHDPAIDFAYYAAECIGEVYGKKPHVDHIVPLRGKVVSGLHVAHNLQLLSESENCSKGRKWLP